MGQRLVVALISGKEVVAAVYYHWSAYFDSTIYRLCELSEDILKAEKEARDPLLGILEGLAKRGGGVRGGDNPEKELAAVHQLYPTYVNPEEYSRNDGIITFTKDGLDGFYYWADGFASINLDTHLIHNGVWYEGGDWLEYEYEDVGPNGEGGFIQTVNSGKVHNGEKICDVDAFNLTCEEIFKLAEFIGIKEPEEPEE